MGSFCFIPVITISIDRGKYGWGRGVRDYEKIVEEAKASALPYENWERLPGETGAAFAAFCAFRDYGPRHS